MAKIDYNKIIDNAMRGIVKKCIKMVEKNGAKLPGSHHFYITFDVKHPQTKISKNLAKLHTDQMTIVIQHQFWDLKAEEDYFTVTLSFNSVREKLDIPYDALISFADPSARFGLQFQNEDDVILTDDDEQMDGLEEDLFDALMDLDDSTNNNKNKTKGKTPKKPKEGGESKVISIDSFRKK